MITRTNPETLVVNRIFGNLSNLFDMTFISKFVACVI